VHCQQLRSQLEARGSAGALSVADADKTREELLSEVVFLRQTLVGKDAGFRRLARYQEKEHLVREREAAVRHAATLLAAVTPRFGAGAAGPAPAEAAVADPVPVPGAGALVGEVVAAATAQARALEAQVDFLESLLLQLPARTVAAVAPEVVDLQMLVSAAGRYRAHAEDAEGGVGAWLRRVEALVGAETVARRRRAWGEARAREAAAGAEAGELRVLLRELAAAQARAEEERRGEAARRREEEAGRAARERERVKAEEEAAGAGRARTSEGGRGRRRAEEGGRVRSSRSRHGGRGRERDEDRSRKHADNHNHRQNNIATMPMPIQSGYFPGMSVYSGPVPPGYGSGAPLHLPVPDAGFPYPYPPRHPVPNPYQHQHQHQHQPMFAQPPPQRAYAMPRRPEAADPDAGAGAGAGAGSAVGRRRGGDAEGGGGGKAGGMAWGGEEEAHPEDVGDLAAVARRYQ
jgi:hypothetical protein